jgi:hypothetical protein
MGQFAIDRDPTGLDEVLGTAPRGDTRMGDQLLESFDGSSGRKGRSSVSTISAGGT